MNEREIKTAKSQIDVLEQKTKSPNKSYLLFPRSDKITNSN